MSPRHEWSISDKRFLKSLEIATTDPPAPLPRFRVEPSDVAGRYWVYQVIEKGKRTAVLTVADVGSPEFPDPRAAAEEIARQKNEEHREKSR